MDAANAAIPALRFTGLMQALAGCLGLAVLAALAWMALTRPAPPEPAAGWGVRVQEHVRVLAASPRSIATDGNAQARAYLVAQLRAMDLAPAVQRATVRKSVVHAFGSIHNTIGVVHNIVARIPGSAPDAARRPALLLATHYDSGSALRDAARGAATAAALLETARALRAAPPASDVVLLFADGHHVGALGAKGFVEQHPLARGIGLALKFDPAGDGDLRLAQTSGAGGAALDGWMRAAPELRGSSLETTLSRMLNDAPHIGPLAGLDAPALLFAGGEAAPPQLGDAMLRLARTYGDMPLARGTQTASAYFSLPLVGPVHHPAWLGWAPTVLSCLMLVFAWRRLFGADGVTEAAQGAFGVCFLLLAVRIGSWNWREEVEAAGLAGEHRLPLLVLAVAACGFVAGLYLLRRSIGAAAAVLGALAWVALPLLPIAFFLPDAAYVLAWPLAAALAAFLVLHSRWGQRQAFAPRLLVLVVGLAPAAALLPPALRDTWLLLGPHRIYLPPMLMALPMLCFASLLLVLRIAPAVGAVLALLAAATFALPGQAAPRETWLVDADGAERLVYYKDMNTWRAYWLLPDQPLGDWRQQLFPGRQPTIFVEVFGWNSPRQWYAEAPREDAIDFPECFLLRHSVGKVRLGEFTVRSKNRAPHIELRMSGAKALRSRLDGVPLTSKESGWSLSLYGMQDRVLRFEIETDPKEIFAVTVQERLPGLPRHLLPPQDAGAPYVRAQSGMTLSTDILRFY
ncbi:M28 family peptidase [Massilia puerhi]|uniref:M28 family peptidase n=1 Tax=Massilia puerhi TaxID=2681550 RepID=UPI00135C88EE|nr:M28 family peptidase [Massilia puerhi]